MDNILLALLCPVQETIRKLFATLVNGDPIKYRGSDIVADNVLVLNFRRHKCKSNRVGRIAITPTRTSHPNGTFLNQSNITYPPFGPNGPRSCLSSASVPMGPLCPVPRSAPLGAALFSVPLEPSHVGDRSTPLLVLLSWGLAPLTQPPHIGARGDPHT